MSDCFHFRLTSQLSAFFQKNLSVFYRFFYLLHDFFSSENNIQEIKRGKSPPCFPPKLAPQARLPVPPSAGDTPATPPTLHRGIERGMESGKWKVTRGNYRNRKTISRARIYRTRISVHLLNLCRHLWRHPRLNVIKPVIKAGGGNLRYRRCPLVHLIFFPKNVPPPPAL